MLKKTLIALGFGLIAATALQTPAFAGKGHHGYDPLWWNGPAGTGHGVLFKKGSAYRTHYRPARSCQSYKRKYLRTGKKYWLRKFEVCVAEYR